MLCLICSNLTIIIGLLNCSSVISNKSNGINSVSSIEKWETSWLISTSEYIKGLWLSHLPSYWNNSLFSQEQILWKVSRNKLFMFAFIGHPCLVIYWFSPLHILWSEHTVYLINKFNQLSQVSSRGHHCCTCTVCSIFYLQIQPHTYLYVYICLQFSYFHA